MNKLLSLAFVVTTLACGSHAQFGGGAGAQAGTKLNSQNQFESGLEAGQKGAARGKTGVNAASNKAKKLRAGESVGVAANTAKRGDAAGNLHFKNGAALEGYQGVQIFDNIDTAGKSQNAHKVVLSFSEDKAHDDAFRIGANSGLKKNGANKVAAHEQLAAGQYATGAAIDNVDVIGNTELDAAALNQDKLGVIDAKEVQDAQYLNGFDRGAGQLGFGQFAEIDSSFGAANPFGGFFGGGGFGGGAFGGGAFGGPVFGGGGGFIGGGKGFLRRRRK